MPTESRRYANILSKDMLERIKKELGLSEEELWKQDFPELTPERDASLKDLHLCSDVRLQLGLFYTAKELEEKRRKVLGPYYIARCYKLNFEKSKDTLEKAKNFFLWKFYSMLAYIENIETNIKIYKYG